MIVIIGRQNSLTHYLLENKNIVFSLALMIMCDKIQLVGCNVVRFVYAYMKATRFPILWLFLFL